MGSSMLVTLTFRATDGIAVVDKDIVFNLLNADTAAPTVPSNLAASAVGAERVTLTWSASSDAAVGNARTSGLAGYRVYRDGVLLTTLGLVTSYDDTTVAANVEYVYTVASIDAAGNLSAQSAAASAMTQVAGWTIPEDVYVVPGEFQPLTAGQSYDVSQHVFTAGLGTPSYTVDSQERNDTPGAYGFTVGAGGVIAVPDTLPVPPSVDYYDVTVDLQLPTVAGDLPTFGILSGGSNVPWTFGHLFKKGDVPTGQHLAASATQGGLAAFQAEVRNRWPDGSVKFAVLSGIGATQIQLSGSTTDTMTGTPVAEPNADVSVTLTGDGAGTYTLTDARANGLLAWNRAVPHKIRQTLGPVMSEFHYYVPTADVAIGLFFYVRAYVGGTYEIEMAVENGYYSTTETTTDKFYTIAVSVNGTQRWSKDLTGTTPVAPGFESPHFRNSRYAMRWWSNPALAETEPQHDVAYLKSTRLVPNFMEYQPSEARLDGLYTGYAPWQFRAAGDGSYINFIQSYQGGTGWNGTLDVLGRWGSLYCTSGDVRAYRATIAHGYTRGTWQVHGREIGTGLPVNMVDNPNARWSSGGTVGMAPVGLSNLTPCSADTSHVPESGFFAYWLTGRHYFLEEHQFWTTFAWMTVTSNNYWWQGTNGLYRYPTNTTRATAWTMRNLGAMLAIMPDNDATGMRAHFIAYHEWLYPLFNSIFRVGGTVSYGRTANRPFGNSLGIMYWGEGYPETRPWMQDFVVSQTSWVADLELPISAAAQSALEEFRNFMCLQAIGRCGINPGEWHYTYAARYGGPSAYCVYEVANATRNSSNLWSTWGEVWNHTLTISGGGTEQPLPVSFPPATLGQTLQGGNIDNGLITTSYYGYLAESLALAVEHGIAGAAEAHQRITTAPNYIALEPDFGDEPESGRRPRA
jgi:hypothetical protein